MKSLGWMKKYYYANCVTQYRADAPIIGLNRLAAASWFIRKLPRPVWKILDVNQGNMATSNAYSMTKNLKHNRQKIIS